jgi:prevent-host-death family protein
LTSRGKPKAAIASIEEYERLEKLRTGVCARLANVL